MKKKVVCKPQESNPPAEVHDLNRHYDVAVDARDKLKHSWGFEWMGKRVAILGRDADDLEGDSR